MWVLRHDTISIIMQHHDGCLGWATLGVNAAHSLRIQVVEALQEAVPSIPCVVMDTLRAAGVDVKLHFRKKHDFKSSMGTHLQ